MSEGNGQNEDSWTSTGGSFVEDIHVARMLNRAATSATSYTPSFSSKVSARPLAVPSPVEGIRKSWGDGITFRGLFSALGKCIKYSPRLVFVAGMVSGIADNYNQDIYNPVKSGIIMWDAMTRSDQKPENPVAIGWGEWLVDAGITVVGAGYKSIGFAGAFAGDAIADVFSGGYYLYKKLSPTHAPPQTPDPLSDPKSVPKSAPAQATPNEWDVKMPLSPFGPTSNRADSRISLVQVETHNTGLFARQEASPSRTGIHYSISKPADFSKA